MAGSIIVGVRSALVAVLAADAGLAGVSVSFQWLPNAKARERVWTRSATFTHQTAGLRAGRNYRDEVGRFDLAVLVEGVGKSAEWTSTRALALGLVCEQVIADRKNNELAVTGLQTLEVSGDGSLTEAFADASHLAELSLPIRYTARLT